MAVTSSSSGSQTCTVTTEHTLATISAAAGVYSLWFDLNASLGGTSPDVFEVRVYSKARSSDTERLCNIFNFKGVQGCQLRRTPIYETPHDLRVSIKQSAGTSRAVPWEVRKL